MESGGGGSAPGHGVRRGSRVNETGLRSLGHEIDRHGSEDSVANERGLRDLGDRIERGSGTRPGYKGPPPGRPPTGGRPKRPRRWSTRRKVVTTLVSVVLLLLALVGAGYGYLRYQWSQVKTVNCSSCVAAADGAPFNVLLIGSDTRVGDTGQAAKSFGSAASFGGTHRSDTIKLVHIDPKEGTARLLSFPRDTYVTMSGLPASSGLTGAQKINTAYDQGPVPLIKTIENTFGIPVTHFVSVDFGGVINTVQTLGGINLRFNYPVRDWDCNGQPCNNQSGLNITKTGCQTLNGNQTLSLARSRYYEYYANGQWNRDYSSDLGRITRQNAIIEATIAKAKSTYNPLTLNSFISSMVHNIEVDKAMSFGDMYSLAERYHAFSPSSLKTYTLPTVPGTTPYGSDVEVVSQPAAQQTIEAFLGGAPNTPTTPPLNASGSAMSVPPPTTTTAPAPSSGSTGGGATTPVTAPPSATPVGGSYDPVPC